MNLPQLFNVLVGDMSIAEPHANHAFAENLKHSRFRKHTECLVMHQQMLVMSDRTICKDDAGQRSCRFVGNGSDDGLGL